MTTTIGGDFGQSHPWPDELTEHLNRFRQGHVVDQIPIFFGNLGADQLWSHPRELLGPQNAGLTIEPDGVLHHAMVLTQGCDIALRKSPWVMVAPVYEASERLSPQQQASAKGWQTRHLVHLTAAWATSGFWVADLRLELPIEKTALQARLPLDAFADSADYPRLSERLADNRKRPDVPNLVLDRVVRPLFAHLRGRTDAGRPLLPDVRELRIQLDDPLTPTRVVLFVVANDYASPDIDGWTEVVATLYSTVGEVGLTLMGPEIVTVETMSMRDYLTSSQIDDADSS